jgi:hypothetical protein
MAEISSSAVVVITTNIFMTLIHSKKWISRHAKRKGLNDNINKRVKRQLQNAKKPGKPGNHTQDYGS